MSYEIVRAADGQISRWDGVLQPYTTMADVTVAAASPLNINGAGILRSITNADRDLMKAQSAVLLGMYPSSTGGPVDTAAIAVAVRGQFTIDPLALALAGVTGSAK